MRENILAVIPAAGSGTRLGLGSKALLTLSNRTLMEWAIASVAPVSSRIRVGVASSDLARAQTSVGGLAEVCLGGRTRAETIRQLLTDTTESYVVIHDAARPFASAELVGRVVEEALVHGAAVSVSTQRSAAVRRHHSRPFAEAVWPRMESGAGETPMCLRRELLEHALDRLERAGSDRSPWEVLVEDGVPVFLVDGEERNIKITTPLDWEIALKVIAPSLA